MVVKERSKFLTKRKFCYGCYEEISSTHTDRNCPKRRKCKICLGKHPAGLHRFKFSSKKADGNKSSTDDDKTVKSNCEYVGDSHKNYTGDLTVLSMCVVPVRIQHEKSNKAAISFAMLNKNISQYQDTKWSRKVINSHSRWHQSLQTTTRSR